MGLAAFGGLRLCGLAAIVRFLFRDESARVFPEAGQTNYRHSDPQLDKSKPAQSLASKSEAGRKPLEKAGMSISKRVSTPYRRSAADLEQVLRKQSWFATHSRLGGVPRHSQGKTRAVIMPAAAALRVLIGKILGIRMLKVIVCVFVLCSSMASASSWDFTYFNPSEGGLLIDTDSIAQSPHGTTKFWTLCAPRFEAGKPMAGYAYSQSLYEIHCRQRLIMMPMTVVFDVKGEPRETEFEHAKMEDIQPDTQEDFLWTYICKPEKRPDMAVAMRQGIQGFLREQRRYASEHLAFQRDRSR